MSKAMMIHEFGGADTLCWQDFDPGMPGPGEVRVRSTAIGLNLIEVGMRSGLYPSPPLPFVPGVESVGVIEAVGAQVGDLHVGARVGCIGPNVGSYAEVRVLPADRLFAIPASIDDEHAAACMVKAMTAEYLLTRTFAVGQGTRMLIHAAAGATGLFCVQLGRHLGAEVFGTVSTREKADLVRGYGCDHPIVYTEESFADRVLDLTHGEGVDVVYDSIGADTFDDSLRCLHYLGTFGLFGIASGMPRPLELMRLDLLTSQKFLRPSLYAYTRRRADLLSLAGETFTHIEQGVLEINIHARFALARAADAHRAVESRRTTGALVLLP